MSKIPNSIDKVRASREGHEFHEVWTARKALQLLLPTDNLVGIAVEGLHPADQVAAASESVEIADIVLYYGKRPTFRGADTVKVVQFKYSISCSDVDFRNSHAKKTIKKFAAAYMDHKKRYSAKDVRNKLEFELITNRPIYPAFEQAISDIAEQKPLSGEIKKQADQFKAACGLYGKPLVDFAGKCLITGLAGSLSKTKRDLSRILVDWSASEDAVAKARLGSIRQVVRDKAGYAGTKRNVISQTDVLAAFEVPDIDELLPCPANIPKVENVVEREQLSEAIALIPKLDKPLLIHAAGGVGKTIFMYNLAKALSANHEVIFFDCFGGGAYRAPEDSRHLPKRGLIHIVNTLAFHGLCDPLLPDNDHADSLVRALRRRLYQCDKTLSTASPDRLLILFIDAIDNSAIHAHDRNEDSFPTLLMESFHYNGPISGVRLITSCRTEHMTKSVKDVPFCDFKLKPFSPTETATYLRERLPNVTQTEIKVAQARSGGNARILEHLVTSDRGLLDQSEIENTIELDDLLTDRIERALSEAVDRGYKRTETNAFLAGLSVLPPPVPLDEYAGAHGMEISAIESFAADLAPLLEQTKHGLMFRDEPTETIIRENFGGDDIALRRVAKNLLNRQDSSVYAARALPGLLQKLDDGKQLFELAFDERFPESIKSIVGKRNIRYARLKAAALHTANKEDHNRLVQLLVELSTIAAGDQRGADYILDYPDLVIAAQDVDATRRLFETRTTWPGTRHARLTIANTLSGDFDEAYRHAVSAYEWIFHHRQQNRDHGMNLAGPERLDIAAIPLCLITQNRLEDAIDFMRRWKDWYAYEVGEHLFDLIRQSECKISGFLDNATDDIGIISSALSFLELDNIQRSQLIKNLSKACGKEKKLETYDGFHQEANYRLQDGLLKASIIATSLGLVEDAMRICCLTPHERPDIWYFQNRFSDQKVFQFLVHAALLSTVKGNELRERDILPKELFEIYTTTRIIDTGDEFRNKLKIRLESYPQSKQDRLNKEKKSISYELKRNAESFIDDWLEPLLNLTKAFSGLLDTSVKEKDTVFLELLKTWTETKLRRDKYRSDNYNHFFQILGGQFAIFALWTFPDLKVASVNKFLKILHEQENIGAKTLIKVVAILSSKSHLHMLAGEQALIASSLIEDEYDVGSRASLYGQLSRAILQASRDESTAFFKVGLEQMDAIGSGEYQFTNELLLFVSSVRGDELADKDFHTLTNIYELNMPEEEEKFPWFMFAKGLSRTSGCKTLSKLTRWDDRSKVSLKYTLLAYLTALIDDDKIQPEDTLALNRLVDPVELYECDTATFAKAIDEKKYPNIEILVTELIQQFEDNNPGVPLSSTVNTLASIAGRVLGETSDTTTYLISAQKQFSKIRDELNEQMNYLGNSDPRLPNINDGKDKENLNKLKELASRTNSNDETSIRRAIDELNEMQHIYNLKEEFFEKLRSNVNFSDRSQYIFIISRLENLDIYTKLNELKKCKSEWKVSSLALEPIFKNLGIPLLQLHVKNFVSFDQLSVSMLNEFSDLSGVPISILALQLIRVFASPSYLAPAAVWLGLAYIICSKADDGEGRAALIRLLNSNSAKLASKVVDGEWKDGLYPPNDPIVIASGMVWRMLGSPHASDRWRAAHSMICFAKFKRWDVIDALVAKFQTEDAHPFQAPELPFYYLHARLWLLIALARIALENPKKIAEYQKFLINILLDNGSPHVLMRHFACQALLACVNEESLNLSVEKEKQMRIINLSPFPQDRKKVQRSGNGSFFLDRPNDNPEPEEKFYVDYDFEKNYVGELSDIFGRPNWEISDMISEVVRGFDPDVKNMYEKGGRKLIRRKWIGGLSSKYHLYGQQLGWHALFLVAGKLLMQYPVIANSHNDDPWKEFLNRWILTRKDGLWLSNGINRPPLTTKSNLLEKGGNGLVITGDKVKIKDMIGVDSSSSQNIVVHGNWHSPDNIEVYISSSLVTARNANTLAKQLLQEEPFFVWLPEYDGYEDEESYLRRKKKGYDPWIVIPSTEGRLDVDDPLGSVYAVRRPSFAEKIIETFSIKSVDPFKQNWQKSNGKTIAHSEAWGYENKYGGGASNSGIRLVCTREFLREVLTTLDSDLLVLVKLQRYEEGSKLFDSKFSHTIAVLQIKKSLDIEYHKGAVNRIHKINNNLDS